MMDNKAMNAESQPGQPGDDGDPRDRGSGTIPPSEPEIAETPFPSDLDIARAEAAEWREKYLRLLAEFDNFRKRVRQDMETQRSFVKESVVMTILPIMDDLDRMLATPGDANDPYRRGAELIRDKLRAYFESLSVQRINAQGLPFNPAEHDALLTRPTADFPPGIVLDVITPGYRLGDRIIRHAQVVVSEHAEVERPRK